MPHRMLGPLRGDKAIFKGRKLRTGMIAVLWSCVMVAPGSEKTAFGSRVYVRD